MVRVTTNKNGKFWATFRVRADQKKGLHFMKVTTVGTTRDTLARLRVFIGKPKPAAKPKPPVVDPPGRGTTDGTRPSRPRSRRPSRRPKPTAKPKPTAAPTNKPPVSPPSDPSDLRGRPLQREHGQVAADVRHRLDAPEGPGRQGDRQPEHQRPGRRRDLNVWPQGSSSLGPARSRTAPGPSPPSRPRSRPRTAVARWPSPGTCPATSSRRTSSTCRPSSLPSTRTRSSHGCARC